MPALTTPKRLHSVEDMMAGAKYAVWFSIPADKGGRASYASSFVDKFVDLRRGPDKQLYARFESQDALDIRTITCVTEAP